MMLLLYRINATCQLLTRSVVWLQMCACPCHWWPFQFTVQCFARWCKIFVRNNIWHHV